ncbi:MAG: ABC transporter transmembrane domain-containing protein, partial [Anaerolineales bacterium]
MLRLTKYLKPYLLLIVLAIALLFVQANADLALPDYLSRIVNNGIQQNGVENAVPTAIRKSEMDKLTLFMTSSEQEQVLGAYTLVQPGSAQAGPYLAQYPALESEAVYVRNDLTHAELNAINPIMGRAFVVAAGIERMAANPAQSQAMAQQLGIDLSKLPSGVDPMTLLQQMPAAQRSALVDKINQQFATLGDSMINQMAVASVKTEYQALGVDTSKLQTNYILRTGGIMLLISLLGGVCTVAVGYLASRTAAGAARDIRLAAFERVENFSSAEFDQFSTASLVTRSTNDITQVQMVIFMIMRMVFYAPIIGVGGVIRAIDKSANMWWIIALAVIVLLGLILTVFSISLPKFKAMQNLIDRLNL